MACEDTEKLEVLVEESLEEVELLNYIKKIEESSKDWYRFRSNLIDALDEDQFKTLYRSSKIYKYLYSLYGKNDYILKSILIAACEKYINVYTDNNSLAKDIIKTSKIPFLRVYLIKLGYHKDIEDINRLVFLDNKEARLFAASRCSYKYLKELRKDSDPAIRLAAYKRLGVDEYLDEMLEDSIYYIRLAAAEAAPIYYPKFKDMADELSIKVFKIIAAKISQQHIPYILGNRNLSNNNASSKYIKKLLDKRLAEVSSKSTEN